MSVETILQALAESSGRAALNRGAILGGTVQQLAALPQQIYDDREHQRQVALANLTAAENIRLRQAQEQRDIAATAHQTKMDAREEQKQEALRTGVAAGWSNTNDPKHFDIEKASHVVSAAGFPELATTLRDFHAATLPKLTSGAPGTMMRDELGQVVPGSGIPEKPPAASPAEFAATANDPTKTPQERLNALNALKLVQQNPAEQETVRHNQAMEQIGRMTAGRELAAQAETVRHNKATELANNPFGNLTAPAAAPPMTPPVTPPIPGQAPAPNVPAPPGGPPSVPAPDVSTAAPGPTGDAFLKTLTPDVASEVKAYAEGRRPFPTGMSMFRLQPLIKLVGQYDPTFDASNYNARNKVRTDLESPSGTGGKTVNALNTAISHAGKLSDLIEALDNSDTPAANVVMNWWNKQTGGTKVTNFEAVQPQLMKEVERLWRGAGGSQGDIDALKASLGPNMGRQQQREALMNFVGLMEGKLQSTEQQRDNALGPLAGKSVPILFEQSKPILQKITQRAAPATSTTAKEGDEQPIPGHPGMTAVFRNGRWIAK